MSNSIIRRAIAASVLAIPMTTAYALDALASKDDFTVQNNARTPITELYISPSNQTTWDENVLTEQIRRGSSAPVTFDNTQNCLYDFMAVFSDGRVVEDYQINVCTRENYVFN